MQTTIEDNGQGFGINQVRDQDGLVLLSMPKRARAAGGTLLLRTASGEGTLVSAHVPIARDK